VRRADEPPLEVERPGVVRTLNPLTNPALGLGQEPGPSVPADVVKRSDLAVITPDDDEALVDDLSENAIARLGDVIVAADVDPFLGEEAFALFEKMSGVDVVAGR
jgi:hypothetical protein